jgi:MoxR-like ATPase
VDWQIGDLVTLVRQRYANWAGFDHPLFVADEIAFKKATIAKADELLNEEAVRGLLAEWAYDELISRLERLGRDNNMLWQRVPQKGDLGILYHPALDKAEFSHQISQLLYAPAGLPDRLHTFVQYAAAQGLPVKWTFPTYFLFLTHPQAALFVKPRAMNWFLKYMGQAGGLPRTPSGPAYAAILEQARLLRNALLPYGVADMVDVQSFIWVCAQEAKAGTGRLDKRAQVELDVPPTTYTIPATAHELRESTAAPAGQETRNGTYTLVQCAAETGFAASTLERWVRAIHRRGQAVFYGPPGTGKTFLAQKLARHLVGGNDGFWEMVQFHPGYAYEDFVQGIRPVSDAAGQMRFERVPGRFLSFCRTARQREGLCVLVLDEINRANVARVLGELLVLLEYRGHSLPLAAGGSLSVPENVRLIGTMNTADRSIALVDYALRRRFAFLHLPPDYDLLRHYHQRHDTGFDVEPLVDLLEMANRRIGDAHYALGITYFLQPDLATTLPDIWQMEIEPYLEEYFYNQPDQMAALRWAAVSGRFA